MIWTSYAVYNTQVVTENPRKNLDSENMSGVYVVNGGESGSESMRMHARRNILHVWSGVGGPRGCHSNVGVETEIVDPWAPVHFDPKENNVEAPSGILKENTRNRG